MLWRNNKGKGWYGSMAAIDVKLVPEYDKEDVISYILKGLPKVVTEDCPL